MIDWIGCGRFLVASYDPSWDFDDPATALPLRLNMWRRQKFLPRQRAGALHHGVGRFSNLR
jgi:hypothetical protein